MSLAGSLAIFVKRVAFGRRPWRSLWALRFLGITIPSDMSRFVLTIEHIADLWHYTDESAQSFAEIWVEYCSHTHEEKPTRKLYNAVAFHISILSHVFAQCECLTCPRIELPLLIVHSQEIETKIGFDKLCKQILFEYPPPTKQAVYLFKSIKVPNVQKKALFSNYGLCRANQLSYVSPHMLSHGLLPCLHCVIQPLIRPLFDKSRPPTPRRMMASVANFSSCKCALAMAPLCGVLGRSDLYAANHNSCHFMAREQHIVKCCGIQSITIADTNPCDAFFVQHPKGSCHYEPVGFPLHC